jgi:hypothetical protein
MEMDLLMRLIIRFIVIIIIISLCQFILKLYFRNSQYRSYCDEITRKAIIEHAIANNLFDQPTYLVYQQVNEVFEKLPFLDHMLGVIYYAKQNSPLIKALTDLFKYHKHRVNLEHYKLILTEDAPLEEVLTQDTITELETI